MTATTDAPPISPQLLEVLETNDVRIRPVGSALRLWRRLNDHERDRLGGDFEAVFRRYGTIGMWMRLRGVSVYRAVIEVARKLSFLTSEEEDEFLQELGETSDDPEAALAQVIATGALVLTERPRAAYWNEQKIAVDWVNLNALWDYFWELCRHAKKGQCFDWFTFREQAKANTLTKLKSRLLKLYRFPSDLGCLIVADGRGTQRLNLPGERIHIFELEYVDILRERTT